MRLTPFGKLVRQHRIEKEVTLSEMSSSIGVSPAFASAVETGSKKIPPDYPSRIAAVLDLDAQGRAALENAASLSAQQVKISLVPGASKSDREIVNMFARRFGDLADSKKDTIRRLLEEPEVE